MNIPLFHMTVASTPRSAINANSIFGINLAHDLRLVNVGLLYTDRVTLCSPAASFALGMLDLRSLTEDQQVEFFEHIAPTVLPGQTQNFAKGFERYREIRCKRDRTVSEMIFIGGFKRQILDAFKPFTEHLNRMAEGTHAEELRVAMASGVVELHSLSIDNIDKIPQEMSDAVGKAIADHTTFPLFDDDIAEIARLGILEGQYKVSDAGTLRSRETGLAANLLQRLPSFDDAPVEDVLAIRHELDRYLARFRSGVITFARAMKSEAWNADFAAESELLFREQVAPAFLDLEFELRANRFADRLISRLASTTGAPVGSVLTMLAVSALGVPVAVGHALGVAVPVTLGAAHAYLAQREYHQREQEIEDKHLFFYLQAQNRFNQLQR